MLFDQRMEMIFGWFFCKFFLRLYNLRLKLLMNFSSSPSFSLSKSFKKSIDDMNDLNKFTPGPIYEVSTRAPNKSALSFSVGKSARLPINQGIQATPAPNKYSIAQLDTKPQIKFAQASVQDVIEQTPNPACYKPDLKQTIAKTLTYSFSSRQPSIMDTNNKNPGPGSYQFSKQMPILSKSKSKKQTVFGTSSRFQYSVAQSPGVGCYQIGKSRLDGTYSIGKANRSPSNEITPGPSDYPKSGFMQENLKLKRGKSLGVKIETHFQTDNITKDAFNKYLDNPERMFATSKRDPKYSIGKQKRQTFRTNNHPGPSEYINNKYNTKQSPAVLMAISQRYEYTDSIHKPGPGNYDPQPEKINAPSFPRSKSTTFMPSSTNPGVGRYLIEQKAPIKTFSFGKSQRHNPTSRNPTGAGDYNINISGGLQASLSRSQRFKSTIENTPGPGDYHVHSLIGYTSQLKV